MAQNPLDAQRELVGAFGQGASKGLQSVGMALPAPKPKQIDLSRWGGISSIMSSPNQTPAPRSYGKISDEGYDIRNLGPVTTPYGGSTRGEAFHPGIDVAMPIGKTMPALRSGTVVSVSAGHAHGESHSYGNRIGIKDAQGQTWYYSHLDRTWAKVGQHVAAGDTIGAAGNTGSAYSNHGGTGSHLDLRIVDAYGKFMNPRYVGITY